MLREIVTHTVVFRNGVNSRRAARIEELPDQIRRNRVAKPTERVGQFHALLAQLFDFEEALQRRNVA